ncbi:MAG: DUF2490 domain-containing protein [Bacteroidota bacterium]|nr:DUF2490 domain-containing protein [Bacteroidota bacterium]
MRTILNRCFLLLFLPVAVIAQENDFQTWASISASKKLIKKTDIFFKQGIRFRENSSLKSKLFTDLKIKRKHNKHFFYAVGYRFSNDWDKQLDFSQKSRFYADIYYKDKYKKRFLVSMRARYQTQGNVQEYFSALRHKSAFAYNIKRTKLEPSIALEYFLYLESMLVEKIRYTIALARPLTKDLDAEIAYRIQQEFYANIPETLFIFEGKLSYDF